MAFQKSMGDLYPTLISPIDLKGSDVTRAFRLCDVAVIVRVDARVGPVTRDRQYIALPSRSPDRRAFRSPSTTLGHSLNGLFVVSTIGF